MTRVRVLRPITEASMSEHTWVLDNIAGYVAGGLDAAERDMRIVEGVG